MSVVIIVILHEFLILEVSVFLLDSVKLVTKRQIVLVSLLDFEDLGLQLRDQEVFLITSQMYGVVVL